jgi:hypothetical protein
MRAGTHRRAPVSFTGVAKAAGISRSWLYLQDDLREEIVRLRLLTAGRAAAVAVPVTLILHGDDLGVV